MDLNVFDIKQFSSGSLNGGCPTISIKALFVRVQDQKTQQSVEKVKSKKKPKTKPKSKK